MGRLRPGENGDGRTRGTKTFAIHPSTALGLLEAVVHGLSYAVWHREEYAYTLSAHTTLASVGWLLVHLSVCLSVPLRTGGNESVCLSVCQSVCLSVCLSVFQSVCLRYGHCVRLRLM